MAKKEYSCENCGRKIELEDNQTNIPECCDQPMQKVEPLPVCETSETAEHSRLDTMGEPCDDGRSGKV
jgi:DNA-directed RNA polymerase subunit RPC12/RpoP